jgi:Homeodomain-like domain
VWRWQQRFAEAGVDGLLRDKTRKPGKAPIPAETTARVVGLTCTQPPHQATHWTGRAMAKATGVSLRSVQRIWQSHQLQPHRIRAFKHSRDPAFAAKLTDIVGSMSIPRPMLWCSRLMKRARSRRSTAPSQGCRSSRGADRP